MSEQVDQHDRDREPRDRFHPDHDSFTDWLDNAAPADQAQKLKNRPKHRRRSPDTNGVICHICQRHWPADQIIAHLQQDHPVRVG